MRHFLMIGVVLVLALGVMLTASAGTTIEIEQPVATQTAIFGTIDAIVGARFDATATQQAVIDGAATSIALTEVAPTLTAAFESTVDARFYEAVTGTAQVVLQTGTPTATLANIVPMMTQASATTVTVRAGAVPALRACPERTCELIRNLRQGEALNVISVQAEWLEVETEDGDRGFIPINAVNAADAALPTDSSPATSPTPTASVTATSAASSRLTAPKIDGIYRVGTEIAAGRWESMGSGSSCYWSRDSRSGDIIDNHFGLAGGTVFIDEGDFEVEFSRCGTYIYIEAGAERELESTAANDKTDGFYTVGVEIVAGVWRSASGSDNCYWSLYDDTGEIIDNYYGSSGGSVRVTENVYEVQFDECGFFSLQSADAGENTTEADTLEIGTPMIGYHSAEANSYALQAEMGQIFVVSLDSGDFDAYLEIRDSSGDQVASDDDSGQLRNARVLFTAPATGEYTVVASSFLDEGEGDFTLTVVPLTGALTAGESLTVDMDGTTRYLYEIDLAVGETYTFSARAVRVSVAVDTNLTLLDDTGEELGYSDDFDGLNPVIEGERISRRAMYYVLLAPYNANAVGEVALLVEQE